MLVVPEMLPGYLWSWSATNHYNLLLLEICSLIHCVCPCFSMPLFSFCVLSAALWRPGTGISHADPVPALSLVAPVGPGCCRWEGKRGDMVRCELHPLGPPCPGKWPDLSKIHDFGESICSDECWAAEKPEQSPWPRAALSLWLSPCEQSLMQKR